MSMNLTNEIEWCKAVIDLRFSQYFSADDSEEKKLQIEMVELPELDEDSPYGLVVQKFDLGFYERLVIALALIPHLCPQALDSFLLNNRTLGRPYTEFGGWHGKSHSGFLPTCETALFLLVRTFFGSFVAAHFGAGIRRTRGTCKFGSASRVFGISRVLYNWRAQ